MEQILTITTIVGATGVVVIISVSLAFGAWFRTLSSWFSAILRIAFDVPWALFFEWAEMARIRDWWKNSIWNSKNLDRKRTSMLAAIARKRREKEIVEQVRSTALVNDQPRSSWASDTDAADPVNKRVGFRMSNFEPCRTTNGRADSNV